MNDLCFGQLFLVRRFALYLLLFVSIGYLFWQCKDDEKDAVSDVPDEISISADRTTIDLPSEANSFELTITASGTDWDVSEEISWLEAMKVDDTKLRVSYQQNTGEARTGKITASIESESLEITVNQSAGPYVVLGATEYMLPPGAAMNHEITLDLSFFRSSSQWYAEKPNATDAATSWLSVVSPSSASKSALESKVLTLNIEENIAPSNRSLSLSLQVEDASNEEVFSSALTMTQSQAVIVLDRTMSIGDASGVRTVTVTTTNGEDWSIKGYQDITDADNPKDTPGWLTPVKDNGLKLTYEKNTGRERTARVILEAGTGNEVFIEITQDKGPVVITVQHYIKKTGSVLSNNDNLPAILIAGRKDTLLVDTNNGTSWTATLPSWASKEERSGGTNLDTLIVTYPSNPDALRSGTLTITSATKTLNLMVRQFALTFIPYVDGSAGSATASMTLTLPEVQFLANKDTVLVDTGAPSSWEVSESLDWITTRKILSDKTGTEDTLEISYLKNTEADTRSADISISAGSVTKTIEVSQGQKALVVNTDAYTLPFSEDAAATVSLDVNFLGAANKWYVDETGAEAWLALVSPTSTAKEDDLSVKNVVFNIKENVTDKDRQTTVTLKVVNASDTELASEVITITQSKAAVVLNTAAYTLPFSENATATVTLDVDFLGTSNQWYIDATGAPNWLELVSPTSSDKEDDLQVKNVVFTIEENSTNEDRKTTVMLKVEDASDTELASRVITITQSKATVVLKKTAYTLPYPLNATATVTLDVDFLGTSNQWYIDVTGAPNWLKLVSPTSSDKEDDLSVKDVVFNITENKTNMDRPATVTLKVEDASDTELASLDITITQSKAAVVLTTTEYTLPYHANATATVTLDADLASPAHEWYIDPGSEPAWLTLVSPTSTDKEGDLNVKDVVFNIKENVTNMDRKATVTLKVEDVSDTELASIDITITQSKAAVVLNTDTYTLPYPLNATATVTLDVDFYLTSNKWYIDATGVDSWLELVSPTSAAKQTNLQSKDVVFKIKENATNMGRSTKVTLKVVDASDTELGSRVITITQSTANVVLTTTAYTLSYPANATATVTLDVDFLGTSNKWYIDPGSEPAWLTLVSPTSTTKQTNLQTKTVTFNIKENVTNIDRKSTVTLKVEDGSDAELASIDITITQSKAAVVLNTDAYTLPYQANATATVTLDVDFYLTSDKWYIDATGVGAWLELVSPKSTAKQTDLKAKTVTFNIKENATNMDRPATVTLKVEDGSGTELGSRVITITQSKAAVVLTTATYTLPSLANPTATVTLDADLASPAHEWYIDAGSAPAWLKLVSPKSSAKQADLQAKTVTFNIKENVTNMDRPATVTLKVEDSSDKELASLDITITQSKATIVVERLIEITAASGVKTVPVTTTNGNAWTVSSYQDITDSENPTNSPSWITPSNDSGLKLEYQGNTSTPRIASIVLASGSAEVTVQVNQARGPVVITVQHYAKKTASALISGNYLPNNISIAGGKDTLLVDTGNGEAWTATLSAAWASKQEIDGGANVDTLIVTYSPNSDDMSRESTIVINSGTKSFTVRFGQLDLGISLLDLSPVPTPLSLGALEGKDTVLVSTGGEAWEVSESLDWITPKKILSGKPNEEDTLEISYVENATNMAKEGEISISVGSVTKTIEVKQQRPPYVVLNTDTYTIDSEGGDITVTLDIALNADPNFDADLGIAWYIDDATKPTWVTSVIGPLLGGVTNYERYVVEDPADKTIELRVETNNTNMERSGQIKLEVLDVLFDAPPIEEYLITITQSKAAVVLNKDAYTLPYQLNTSATVTLDVDFYLTSDKWYIDPGSEPAWLTLVSPTSTAKEDNLSIKNVVFNIKENKTDMDRPATVTLKVEDGSGTELGSRVITITQSKAAVVLNTDAYTLPYQLNATATVTLDVALAFPADEWYIDPGSAPAWLTLVSPNSSTKEGDISNKDVVFNIEENVLATDRPATVTLKVEDVSDTELASLDITITQSKATIVVERLIEITAEESAASGVKTVPVTTTNGAAWTVSSYQDITDSENPTNSPSWITPSKDSGLKLEYQGNTSAPRVASIVLASGSAEVTVQVNQAQGAIPITVQHYVKKTASALKEHATLPDISLVGRKDTLLVDTGSGEAWTATTPAWASPEKIDGGSDVDTLIVTYSSVIDNSREGTITITSGMKTFALNVSQVGLELEVCKNCRFVEGDEPGRLFNTTLTLPQALPQASKDTVLVYTGGEAWSVTESLDWITTKQTLSGKTNEEDTLEISYTQNDTDTRRIGDISITSGSLTKTIKAEQGVIYVVLNQENYVLSSEEIGSGDRDCFYARCGTIQVTLDVTFHKDVIGWYVYNEESIKGDLEESNIHVWIHSFSPDFITPEKDATQKNMTIEIVKNVTDKDRTSEFALMPILKSDDPNDLPLPIFPPPYGFTITQSKAPIIVQRELRAPNTNGQKVFPVTTTNGETWTFKSHRDITYPENPQDAPAWLRPRKSKQNGRLLVLYYQQNRGPARIAEIILEAGTGNEVSVRLTQKKGVTVVITVQHYVEKTASRLNRGTSLPDISQEGRKDTLLVDTGNGTPWTAAIPAWASQETIDGGADRDTLIVTYSTYSPPSDVSMREGKITIASARERFVLNVKQVEQKPPLAVLNTDTYTISSADGIVTVTLDVDFKADADESIVWRLRASSQLLWADPIAPVFSLTDFGRPLTDSDKTIELSVAENDTDTERRGQIILEISELEILNLGGLGTRTIPTKVEEHIITIVQSKAAAVVLNTTAYTLPYQANATATVTLDVALASPAHEWYIDPGSEPAWLTLVSPKSSAKQADLQAKDVVFNIKENVTNMDRPATVTLKVEDSSDKELASLDITITQSKATIVVERLIEITAEESAASGVKTVPVTTTNGALWTVSSYQDITDSENPTNSPSWITPSKDSGLKLEYQGNTSAPRVASIVLASGSAEVTVQVNQAKGAIPITVQHYVKKTASALNNNDNLPDIPLAGRKDTLLVDTGNGTAWTATIPSWVTQQKIDGGANVDTLIVTYSSVADNSMREGTITITSDMRTFTLNVEQKPPPYAVLNTDTYTIASAGGDITVTLDIEFNDSYADLGIAWYLDDTTKPTWVTSVLGPLLGAVTNYERYITAGPADKTIELSVEANNTNMERSGKIKLEIFDVLADAPIIEEHLITITQEAASQ